MTTISITNSPNSISVTNTPNQITVYDGLLQTIVYYTFPSYTHTLGSGNRPSLTGLCTATGAWADSFFIASLESSVMFDGDTGTNGHYPVNEANVAGCTLEFDFSTLGTYLITEMKFYYSGAVGNGTWKVQGWDGSAWVDIGSSFTLGTPATQTIDLSTNTTGYTKYRLLGISGTSSWFSYWREFEFKIGELL
jgi:hypothetical protein